MYQMSQGYSTGLEAVIGSYQGNVAYSTGASLNQSYDNGMFIPTSKPFVYQELIAENPTYQRDTTAYNIISTPHQEYHFKPDMFLKPGKGTKFVGEAEEIREFVEETFQQMFNQPFPEDIRISVLDKEEFSKIAPHGSTIGLSINRRQHGLLSEIFVLNDTLGRVMLTMGHELGHVLTPTLGNSHSEEAKAYAFSFVWMEVIKQHNIAGLADAIVTENPARNGLHDIAFEFILDQKKEGKSVENIYTELIGHEIHVPAFAQ